MFSPTTTSLVPGFCKTFNDEKNIDEIDLLSYLNPYLLIDAFNFLLILSIGIYLYHSQKKSENYNTIPKMNKCYNPFLEEFDEIISDTQNSENSENFQNSENSQNPIKVHYNDLRCQGITRTGRQCKTRWKWWRW